MISINQGQELIAANTPVVGVERIDLEMAVGRVLAEDIIADTDLPPFDRAQMDGYAVVASDTTGAPVKLKLVGESVAGKGWRRKLGSGEAVRIMTGAPVPAGADAVQKVELTRGKGSTWADHAEVEILESVKPRTSIVSRGSEVASGTRVLSAGERITVNNIATLAAFGCKRVKVAKRPRVAVMSTGSEIVDIARKPGRDQIRNSNSMMLKSLAERFGAAAVVFPSPGDSIDLLIAQIRAAAKGQDVLLITGGVSVGKYDLTKAALAKLGAQIFFEKISLKPGKPMVFARLGKTRIFALPGNPVSAAVTFYVFVRGAILRMQAAKSPGLATASAVTPTSVKAAKDRDTFLPASRSVSRDARLTVTPLKWQGSSDLIGFAAADSLISLKAGEMKSAGEVVEVVLLDD